MVIKRTRTHHTHRYTCTHKNIYVPLQYSCSHCPSAASADSKAFNMIQLCSPVRLFWRRTWNMASHWRRSIQCTSLATTPYLSIARRAWRRKRVWRMKESCTSHSIYVRRSYLQAVRANEGATKSCAMKLPLYLSKHTYSLRIKVNWSY